MFGKKVTVSYKGRDMEVLIKCVPSTPTIELKERALKKLEGLEIEHPLSSLEDIQSLINMGVL
ncbi:hypothetical protein WKH57_01225 [Niallia taxi]|uniref:hypothetical protein n=1 Tax=Niallia taxi TaxID=2499688 RepID=UPI003182AD18